MPRNLSLDGTDFPVRSYLIKSSPLTHCQGPKFRGVDLRGVDVHGLEESSGCSPRSEKDKDYKPSVRKKICHLLKNRFLSLNPHADVTTSVNPEKAINLRIVSLFAFIQQSICPLTSEPRAG